MINQDRERKIAQWIHKCPTDREFVRDRERKLGYSLHKGAETLVRHREKLEGCSRWRESTVPLYIFIYLMPESLYNNFIVEERIL